MFRITGFTAHELWGTGAIGLDTLACWAAVSLDNERLRRSDDHQRTMVFLLAEWLRDFEFSYWKKGQEQKTEGWYVDPCDVVLLFRVLRERRMLDESTPHIRDLVLAIGQIRWNLEYLSHPGRELDEEDIQLAIHIRDFCLALSRQSSAQDREYRRYLFAA